MEPVILDSARKHGIADEDMLHAYRNAVFVVIDDDTDVSSTSEGTGPATSSRSGPSKLTTGPSSSSTP